VQRAERMRGVRQHGTALELLVRTGLHKRGLRYRVGNRNLPGSPDLVFPGLRAVVFVHGCFWHAHNCRLGKRPSTNQEFWEKKAFSNRERDRRKEHEVRSLGWRVFVVWQCELAASTMNKNLDLLAQELRRGPYSGNP
jgi:DNA mismatch endonuclease (patch repair protein)